MKAKKVIAVILAVLPLAVFAVGLVLYAIPCIGAKIDPYYWFEHLLYFMGPLVMFVSGVLSIPCAVIARILNKHENRFVNVVTIVDLALSALLFVAFIVDMFSSCSRRPY